MLWHYKSSVWGLVWVSHGGGAKILPITEIPPLVVDSAEFFQPVFSWHQNQHFMRYLTGLMTDINVTVSHISGRFTEPVSQRSLNRFLTEYEWSAIELNQKRIKMLQDDSDMRWHSKGVVVLDDTLVDKSGKLIPGAGKFYDHNTSSFVHAQNIVRVRENSTQRTLP